MVPIYLWFNAAMYLVLGVWCTALPDKTAAAIGFAFARPGARSEYITVYGGMEFGLGIFFLLCAWNTAWRDAGLLLGLCLYGGLTLWRLYTFLTIDGISGFPRIAFALELALLVAAAALWWRR
ncbi:MAG: DUF4345 family protein [Planctomycetota bacterium]|jgi:hypothetical protein